MVLDGAKNVAGAHSSSAAVREEFGDARTHILVVGMLSGKSALEMLEALDAPHGPVGGDLPASISTCPAGGGGCRRGPVARLPGRIATGSVAEALELALAEAGEDDMVLVTGSLYTVGAARTALVAQPGLEAGNRLN